MDSANDAVRSSPTAVLSFRNVTDWDNTKKMIDKQREHVSVHKEQAAV